MKRFIAGAIVATVVCFMQIQPAAAEDAGIAKKIAAIPLRTAGCACALFVGTPIAMTRLGYKRYKTYMTEDADMTGPGGGPFIYAIPMGIGEGFAHGLYYGPKNAIANFDQPFSKQQLSLGKVAPEPGER